MEVFEMEVSLPLSKPDLQNMLDLTNRCLHATRIDQISDAIDLLQAVVPFGRAALCVIDATAPPEACFKRWLTNNFDRRWVDIYLARGYHRIDPVIRYALQQDRPFTWRAAFDAVRLRDDLSLEFLDNARQFGLQDGAAHMVGTAGHGTCHTLLSVSLPRDDCPQQYLRILELALPHIHQAMYRVAPNCRDQFNCAQSVHLTPRESDVLRWVSTGKTAWEIAQILNIKERTVKFHLSGVFAKLDVVNRSQAVAKALRLGLIPG
jgi:LuxR family quorum sensing-dependent transcriptional regulator